MSTNGQYSGQVLVVDDDPITCELLQAELEEQGFRVTTATDLAELKQRVLQRAFDFVLLDLFLGEEDGLSAIPFLVRESPYSRIIVMSAHGTVQLAVDAMEKGASSFVAKSKDPRELIAALKSKLSTRTPQAQPEPEAAGAEPVEAAKSTSNYGIVGDSPAIHEVLGRINQIRDVDSTVLIVGESGTGKELVARALHASSKRAGERFEAINCGAIPENLLESELFGHRKGAFTDAKADRKGLFELCREGTLFLDEIGEMPLNLQVKLLRVLQEKEVMPLGATTTVKVDTRVIAATNRNLLAEVKKGTFRADLYYRLAVLQMSLPALRERPDDIPRLACYFLEKFNQRFGKQVQPPSRELETRLKAYAWPGNIRELQNAVERGVVLSTDGQLHLENMLDSVAAAEVQSETEGLPGSGEALWQAPLSEAKKQFEKIYLQHLLEVTRGNISEIARISGRYRADIYRLMTKYGVDWEEFRPE